MSKPAKAGRQLPVLQQKAKNKFDCWECPGRCCTYDLIEITAADIRRLARRHDLTEEVARKRFTKQADDNEGKTLTVLKHREDDVYETACMFLHPKKRVCTVYDSRPGVCRQYPYGNTCGYYQFLTWERKRQGDPDIVP
ncbi:MAG: YkgJ family cysteine cluster protein [Acidobacteriota bacterium]